MKIVNNVDIKITYFQRQLGGLEQKLYHYYLNKRCLL